jgi:NTP pyrophosphatase (non-canonical NTP hydrolase)
MDLKQYQREVSKLAKEKGYNQELFYLFGRMIQEATEMLDAIWQNKSDEEVAEEGADLLHFFFQILDHRPYANIERGMLKKIASNYIHKKKTNEGGKMVRK